MTIPARISLVTLGVSDVARSTAFYEGLGWPLAESSVPGEISFFRTPGAALGLFGLTDLATDANQHDVVATGFRGVSLAINCASTDEVDQVFRDVEAAGATILKPPVLLDWGGYSGYFADPDGHAWEVAHNPQWELDADGIPQLT